MDFVAQVEKAAQDFVAQTGQAVRDFVAQLEQAVTQLAQDLVAPGFDTQAAQAAQAAQVAQDFVARAEQDAQDFVAWAEQDAHVAQASHDLVAHNFVKHVVRDAQAFVAQLEQFARDAQSAQDEQDAQSSGVRLVNVSQLLDATTSVLFLYLNPHDGCKAAGITVVIVGFFGALSAIIGWCYTTPMNKVVAFVSAITNAITVIVGIVIVAKGSHFQNCTSQGYQGPIVWPALFTVLVTCLFVD